MFSSENVRPLLCDLALDMPGRCHYSDNWPCDPEFAWYASVGADFSLGLTRVTRPACWQASTQLHQ